MKEKVLIYDLETGGVNALKSDLGFVLCFGYKWLGDKTTHCLTLDKFDGFKKNGYCDKELLKAASKIIQEADVLVAHFGDVFDRRFINGRLAINKLPPIPKTKQVDTCIQSYKTFNFSSNRLKHLAQRLNCKHRKEDSVFPDWWMQVMAGDIKVLKKMAHYCKQDVRTTEEVYLRLRPYYNNHPMLYKTHTVDGERKTCKICNGGIHYRGVYKANHRQYRKFVCTKCGRWDHDTKALPER